MEQWVWTGVVTLLSQLTPNHSFHSSSLTPTSPSIHQSWFLSNTYLPYALGGGYVLGMDLVAHIARNSELLSHYNSEVGNEGEHLHS